MSATRKLFLLFSLVIIALDQISGVNINALWPYIDSIQFPYPTNDPINIITSEAKQIFTPTPLIFRVNPTQPAIVTNSGSSLLVNSTKRGLGEATGGVLFNDKYFFFDCEFFWDDSLSTSAAVEINGKGSVVQAVASFFNTKYGDLNNAKSKRDGIAQIVVFIDVKKGPVQNLLYNSFKNSIKQVRKAGTSVHVAEILAYDWYFTPSITNYYYSYPGKFQDRETGEIYYSSTVIVLVRTPRPFISYTQFENSFGLLENKNEKRYSHIARRVDRGERPVVKANGLILALKF